MNRTDDLISRQAAIDALDVLCQEHRYRIPGKRETYSQYNEAWQDALDRAEGAIGNLPSAQPEPCEDAVSRRRLLSDLKKLIVAWEKYPVMAEQLKGVETAIGYVEAIPSVTPKQKTGKWNAYYHGINETPSFTYSCNQCGYSAPYGLYGGKYSQKKWNFCPNCGAKMI